MNPNTPSSSRPTTRSARRGMSLAEWRRQNSLPRLPHDHLHADDLALVERLWAEGQGRGIAFRALAALYFPHRADLRSAANQLSYELRMCRGLPEALRRLGHPDRSSRFTCLQVEQIFLLYGSPP